MISQSVLGAQKRSLTTSEAASLYSVTSSTLRHWVSIFPMLRPVRRSGRCYYDSKNILVIRRIKELLDKGGNTIDQVLLLMVKETYKPTSNIRKRIQLNLKRKANMNGMKDLPTEYVLTHKKLMELCRISEKTARRYIVTGKAPYLVCKIIELTLGGRILPDSWRHCFINHRDNIEVYQVGELTEDELTTRHWERARHADLVRLMDRKLEKAQKRIIQLERYLDGARLELGEMPAANN